MITLNNEDAEKLGADEKLPLKAHLNTAMYGAAAYANGNSDRVIYARLKRRCP